MKNKFLYYFFVLCLLTITSCNNITNNFTEVSANKDFTFSLGESAADSIIRTILKNKNITNDSELKVVCELFGVYSNIQTKIVALPELKNVKFNMSNLPFGNGYYFRISVYHNDIILYKGVSDSFNLSKDEKDVKIKLVLNKELGSIKYVLNDGAFSDAQEKLKLTEYFVDTNYIIPEPSKSQFLFDGWYINPEFNGNPVKELGQNNYFGNVTLYAKWREFDKVSNITFYPESDFIDFGDKVALLSDENDISIYYTTDSSIPTENSLKYTEPFAINNEKEIKDNFVTVKSFSLKPGMKPSDIVSKKYEIKRYSINLNLDGGGPAQEQISNLKKGDVILISDLPVVTKDGFNFSGWNIGNETLKDSYIVKGGDEQIITFTAQWTEKDRTPKVSITGEPLIEYGEEIILSCETAPDAEIYYTIDGSVPDKSSSKYIPGTTHIKADNDFTLKAIAYKDGLKESYISETSFTIKKYKVTFNDGGHGTAPSEITGLKKGDTLTEEQLAALVVDGYNFIQWQTDLGVKFDSSFVITEDVNLIAKWAPITYTIVFDSNGGTGVKDSITVTYDTDIPFGDNPFTKEGFEFEKWSDITGKIEYTSANNLCKKQGESITVYAKWKDLPPADVTDVKFETSDGRVLLSWKNPIVSDFDNVEITCKEDSSKNLTVKKDTSKDRATAEYTGLPNDKLYTFTLKAVDGGGNKSTGVEKKAFASAGCQLTETVKNLPSGTDGSAGTSGTYVEFGDYPQSLIADNVILSDNLVKVNNIWDCYLGHDGINSAYYVKVTANMFENEYHNNHANTTTLYTFNNKELIKNGTEYYFKLEPIKWRVVDTSYTDGGNIAGFQQVTGKLLVAEKALAPTSFYNCSVKDRSMNGKKIEFNNYQYSTLRAYLNGMDGTSWGGAGKYSGKGFINEAFTPTAKNILNMVTLDNSMASSKNCPENNDPNWKEHNFYCEPIQDKVFVLSQEEVTNKTYFPEDWMSMAKNSRFRQSTEYSRTIGGLCTMGDGTNVNMYNSDWWLRSPNYANGWQSRYVGNNGRPNRSYNCDFGSASIVPAIVIEGTRSPDRTAPGPVAGLKCTTGNGKVVFTWTPPIDRDFDHVEIICKEDAGKKVTIKKGTNTGTISGLTNGQKYTFEAKSYDATGNCSSAVPAEASLYILTENIKNLPSGTDGSAGTSGTYVEFGDYPQTYVANAPVGTDKVTIGGLDYYYGSDGYYYVKAKASASASSNSGKNFGDKDNTPIVNGNEYCFRVEPVKWRVVANTYGGASGKVLLAENILVNSKFKSTTGAGSNVYSSSDLKAFVTGNMFNQLFSSAAQGNVLQVTSGDLSNEKIFLLSKDDALNPDYGFVNDEKANTARSRLTTDYSRALGAYSDNSTKNGSWWLRTNAPAEPSASPAKNDSDYVWIVGSVGGTGNSETVNNSNGGVVPAVVVK